MVDAAIAVSFALGVVEPEASGIGGDGMALIYLNGNEGADRRRLQRPGAYSRDAGQSDVLQPSASDGPAAANIPGVVAGLDYMFRRYGSEKVSWSDLIAPAIAHAEDGYVLDEALPTSIAEGRRFFEKYGESTADLPAGREGARPGDRFVNKDYGATLRAIAKDGAQTFLSRRDRPPDRGRHGHVNGGTDHARRPGAVPRDRTHVRSRGRYRDHVVYSAPPPVSTGLNLIETLQILQNYQPRAGASYATDADYFHYAIEAWKVRDSGARIADPALLDVNLGPHLDPSHAASLFRRIDPAKASRFRTGRAGQGERRAGRRSCRQGILRETFQPSGSAAERRRSPWPTPTAT